jgi:HEAT repeat protein
MIHAQPDLAVPALCRATQDADKRVRHQAVYGLSAFGPEAKPALQPFVPMLKALDLSLQCDLDLHAIDPQLVSQLPKADYMTARAWEAISGLEGIDEKEFVRGATFFGASRTYPDKVVPALVRALAHSNAVVQCVSADALANYGPEAKPAIPALVEALTNHNPIEVREAVTDALRIIDPKAATSAGAK